MRDPTPSRRFIFSILHTNDLHSNFLGIGPVTDYTPERSNPHDKTIGGYARLATLLRDRKRVLEAVGPVLVLDAGDFSVGTALGAASRETGAELRVMAQMGYDATTLGNHDFDFGAQGLGRIVGSAADAGPVPAVVSANVHFDAPDARLAELRRLTDRGIIRPYVVITRGGIRFGIFGLLGYDAQKFLVEPGALQFDDPIDTARVMASRLRDQERVHEVICLSHGGVQREADGTMGGEDLRLATAVPAIDVVVGGHTHTLVPTPLRTLDGAAVLQADCYGQRLGELVFSLDHDGRQVRSYTCHTIDATIAGEPAMVQAIAGFTAEASRKVFAPYGYEVLQRLAIVPRDIPSSASDLAVSAPLGNLVTDAIRQATGADVGLTANGALRAGLSKGTTGVQTVYDVFGVVPLGFGVVDPTAGGALVTGYFTGKEMRNLLEFFVEGSPTLPGQYFPRTSGLRLVYDRSRPRFDKVTKIELGDLQTGYRQIDGSSTTAPLYSVSCNIYVGVILTAIPHLTQGLLALEPKNRAGVPLQARVEALDDPRTSPGPYVLPPKGTVDPTAVHTVGQTREIKEWKALMDYLKNLPQKSPDGLAIVQWDDRLTETRAIQTG
jgi:5'-nucleotidase